MNAPIPDCPTTCLTVDVKTCARMLGLGLRSTYRLVERSYREQFPLRVLRFGTAYRISVVSVMKLLGDSSLDYVELGG